MKKLNLLLLILLTAISASAFDDDFHATDLNFSAPIVFGDPLSTNSQVGAIVYDLSTNTFRGLFSNGSWNTLPGTGVTQTVQKFTTSGSCTYSTTTSPKPPLYLKIRMIAGGGGGGGGQGGTAGGTGGTTSFNSVTAIGGSGGAAGQGGGNTGTATGGIGGTGGTSSFRIQGAPGGNGALTAGAGSGGNGVFGGGAPGAFVGAGVGGTPNTGGGASGGYGTSNGGGGGAGEYAEFIISSPSGNYSCNVGAGGTAGNAGTAAGGVGGTGIIIVEEHYQ